MLRRQEIMSKQSMFFELIKLFSPKFILSLTAESLLFAVERESHTEK